MKIVSKIYHYFGSLTLKYYLIIYLLGVLLLCISVNVTARSRYQINPEGFDSSEINIWPRNNDSLPVGYCNEIRFLLPDSFAGKMAINKDYVNAKGLKILLYQYRDTITVPDSIVFDKIARNFSSQFSDSIQLIPMILKSGRECIFPLMEELKPGRWLLNIPDDYFELLPEYIDVKEPPFSQEELMQLNVSGAWHIPGTEWNHKPMFSIHDDDGVDGKIPSCGAMHIPDRTGYFSMLYPLLQSLGVRGNVSMEGWRCGFTDDPPKLNENGEIMLRLEQELGWEMQAHSMEVLGDRNNNFFVDSLSTELAENILHSANGFGPLNATTSVYDNSTGKQYYPNENHSEWIEAPINAIKPYALDYKSKTPVLYIKDHNIDYHWGEWFRLAKEFGFKATAWVQHNAMTSHAYATEINNYANFGFNDMSAPYQYNVPPLCSTATRMLVEGQAAPGYIGEMSDDNTYDYKQFDWFKDYIDNCIKDNGWIVLALHTYRKCWKNYIPGCLISEGGDYPDEWVEPLEGMDYLNDSLTTPPQRLGITDWSEWRPCPGTRLEMLRDLILYCINNGMENVTSSEGFEIMGNVISKGYFNNGVRCGYDRFILQDDRNIYPHYIESATGEILYYNPGTLKSINSEFSIIRPNIQTSVPKIQLPIGEVRYYDINGEQVSPHLLRRGIYIRLDNNGYSKIVR